MHRSPRYRSSSPSSDLHSQSPVTETDESLVIPDPSVWTSTAHTIGAPGPKATKCGEGRQNTGPKFSTRDGSQTKMTWTAEDAGGKTSRPFFGSRGVSDTRVPTIAPNQHKPILRRQLTAGLMLSVLPGIAERTGLSLDQYSLLNGKDSSSTDHGSMSSGAGCLASYHTDLSRQTEHGISASARPEFGETLPLLLPSSVHFASQPGINLYQRSAARRPLLKDRTSESEDVKVSSSSAPVTSFTSPAPTDGQPRRGSAEQQSEKGYFSFRYKPARPQCKRWASQQNVSTASKLSVQSQRAKPQFYSSLATDHVVSVAPPTPLATSPPLSLAGLFSPAPFTPSDPHVTGGKRPSILRRMFSSLMTPRSESTPTQSRPNVDRTSEPSAIGTGDYFGTRQAQYNSVPEQGYNAGEAIWVSTPPELKILSRRPPKAMDDAMYDYLPSAGNETGYNPGSALDDWDSDRDTSKQGVIRSTGSLSDSAIRHAPFDQHPSLHWFRERTVEIEDDDGASVLTFDWDIPVHLPNSPLCPLHPKHRGSKKGACAYHGRRKTHPTQLEEKGGKDNVADKRIA